MKKFDVWLEGYRATGEHGTAQLIGEGVEAETFPEACVKAMLDNNWGAADLEKYYDKERNTYWGCRFFDNEKDARASFG